ncbi:DUF4229 domain-containing protein [Sanguibacter sp. 25GB23B1]|uniref:DUF4229 domain-containing protein n=1 Tax=unclassified Sanguibacter TaxID=2645534 RepID=UPI0032AFDE76
MALLKYSVLRLALLAVIAVALYAAGLRGLPLIVVAPVVALMVSYVVLGGPREAAAVELAERRTRRAAGGERFSRGIEDDAAAEDATIDRAAPRPARPVTDLQEPAPRTAQQGPAQHTSDREPEGK